MRLRLRVPGFEFIGSIRGLEFQASTRFPACIGGFWFWISDFPVCLSGFGFRVSGFGFRISDFGFRVLDLGFSLPSGLGTFFESQDQNLDVRSDTNI